MVVFPTPNRMPSKKNQGKWRSVTGSCDGLPVHVTPFVIGQYFDTPFFSANECSRIVTVICKFSKSLIEIFWSFFTLKTIKALHFSCLYTYMELFVLGIKLQSSNSYIRNLASKKHDDMLLSIIFQSITYANEAYISIVHMSTSASFTFKHRWGRTCAGWSLKPCKPGIHKHNTSNSQWQLTKKNPHTKSVSLRNLFLNWAKIKSQTLLMQKSDTRFARQKS